MGLQKLKAYLQGAENKTKDEIKTDLENVPSLQCKGSSPDGRFVEYADSKKRKRVKIHPPDAQTLYPHLHLYDSEGNSLTKELEIEKENTPAVHIKIKKS